MAGGLTGAIGWSVRPIVQAFKSVAFVACQPTMHRACRDATIPGHLAHRPTVADYSRTALYLCSVTLISLMRGSAKISRSSCDVSAEGVRHINRRPFRTCQPNLHIEPGARAGSRTLNLGIKRLRARSVRECHGVPNPLRFMTQQCHRVSGSVRECLREGVG